MKILLLLCCLLLAHTVARAQVQAPWVLPDINSPRVKRVLFDSAAAKQQVSCYVFTPEPYDRSTDQRFPVLYWLHGSGGSSAQAVMSHTRRYAAAMREGKMPLMIIVFPNGLPNGMWCDWKDGSIKLETIVLKELIPHIDRTYRTVAAREGRIIEGFSMGGYGSARLALAHPDMFCAASPMGAGPMQPEFTETPRASPRMRERLFRSVYGGDMDCYRALSPWKLAEVNAANLRSGLLLRQIVGEKDETMPNNRAFHQHLEQLKIPHTYRELPGIPHNPDQVLDALGEDNWKFYVEALRKK
ncbi:MAG: hypothetical protein K1X78_05365 [Verrucomicrobiaceae bacterium]|nr:hypothetical protein [Verrucomicrobiaceae bacterium]